VTKTVDGSLRVVVVRTPGCQVLAQARLAKRKRTRNIRGSSVPHLLELSLQAGGFEGDAADLRLQLPDRLPRQPELVAPRGPRAPPLRHLAADVLAPQAAHHLLRLRACRRALQLALQRALHLAVQLAVQPEVEEEVVPALVLPLVLRDPPRDALHGRLRKAAAGGAELAQEGVGGGGVDIAAPEELEVELLHLDGARGARGVGLAPAGLARGGLGAARGPQAGRGGGVVRDGWLGSGIGGLGAFKGGAIPRCEVGGVVEDGLALSHAAQPHLGLVGAYL